ncbi:ABC transporter permease [Nitrosomonas sp. JL21]|uniref:ABC transporter permease n=1 Tax=Nitrosomonas sp. JL21 TaxID=153949 RepID=UPI00136DDFEC|nr:ABC transporter permease [Nitrosomonas sp. JL21]MBL8498780.1 ABC transporter permease [Nitrosomonas sp.]MCC7090540.1 ABC transporter permease [Nitrosomonas sp.]MXS78050.1 ABC transporter permease [Nitrosomonas sp. JL21]
MNLADTLRFAFRSLTAHRLRTILSISAIAVGIAAVILLTAIGDGVQRFVLSEFTQFGTNIITISPGKINTHGGSLGAIGSARLLTIEDAMALKQSRYAQYTNASVVGNAEIRANGRSRRVTAYGQGADFSRTFNMQVAIGQFLPHDDPRNPRAYVVLGAKVRTELFGDANPLGALLQVGGSRFRVIGVMASKGQVLGFDLDDTVFMPTTRALEVFNRQGVMEINVSYFPEAPIDAVVDDIHRILVARHGREDFTITPQKQMLSTLSTVLNVLKFAVAALGGISLLVGAIGMITLMHIAVSERVSEIGLLTALGATRTRIRVLFLVESIALSTAGGLVGLAAGSGIAGLLKLLISGLPVNVPWDYVVGALCLSMLIGLAAGVIPAMRAAQLNPVDALRTE